VPDRLPSGGSGDLDGTLCMEKDDLAAEVIYAGGGNCAILFAGREAAFDFATRLSRRLLSEAPDLQLVVAHLPVDWQNERLTAKVQEALGQLLLKKLSHPVSTPLLGQGVTVACRSTGLPAVEVDGDGRPLSAAVLAKLRVVEAANRRLADLFPEFGRAGWEIPYDFDKFGRQAGDVSYIAVVHADGNDVSGRLETLRREMARDWRDRSCDEANRAYVAALRAFSRAVDQAAGVALEEIGTLLLRHWRPDKQSVVGQVLDRERDTLLEAGKPVALAKGRNRPLFAPFRPLVFGGDDLTFVCDGRLGLGLAAAYLAAYERAIADAVKVTSFVAGLQACAGVAVVKAHYPFARAYDLAEDLCRNAKRDWERACSALDWHFAATGLFGDVEAIRERHYTGSDGRLEMRPVPLTKQAASWRSWPGFSAVTKDLLILDDNWRDRRNKIIALRQALRDGSTAVRRFRRAYDLETLPLLDAGTPELQDTGWDGRGRCGYFDAVEALDFYLPLDG